MPGFRRAQLRGSEEFFRQTEETTKVTVEETVVAVEVPSPEVHPIVTAPDPDSRAMRLSTAEINSLIEAIQHLKFPGKAAPRPSVEEFERLEQLRQKLIYSL